MSCALTCSDLNLSFAILFAVSCILSISSIICFIAGWLAATRIPTLYTNDVTQEREGSNQPSSMPAPAARQYPPTLWSPPAQSYHHVPAIFKSVACVIPRSGADGTEEPDVMEADYFESTAIPTRYVAPEPTRFETPVSYADVAVPKAQGLENLAVVPLMRSFSTLPDLALWQNSTITSQSPPTGLYHKEPVIFKSLSTPRSTPNSMEEAGFIGAGYQRSGSNYEESPVYTSEMESSSISDTRLSPRFCRFTNAATTPSSVSTITDLSTRSAQTTEPQDDHSVSEPSWSKMRVPPIQF